MYLYIKEFCIWSMLFYPLNNLRRKYLGKGILQLEHFNWCSSLGMEVTHVKTIKQQLILISKLTQCQFFKNCPVPSLISQLHFKFFAPLDWLLLSCIEKASGQQNSRSNKGIMCDHAFYYLFSKITFKLDMNLGITRF